MVPLYIKYKIILSCTLEIYQLLSRTLTKVGDLILLVLICVYIGILQVQLDQVYRKTYRSGLSQLFMYIYNLSAIKLYRYT